VGPLRRTSEDPEVAGIRRTAENSTKVAMSFFMGSELLRYSVDIQFCGQREYDDVSRFRNLLNAFVGFSETQRAIS